MPKTCTIDPTGRVIVTEEGRQWTCDDADQAEKHLPTWRDARAGAQIAAGDASAIADAANELRKQRAS